MKHAVFLDRDNTLIANDGDLGDPALVQLLPGVQKALTTLAQAGWQLVVVTNQGGVARGHYEESDVDRVHDRVQELLGPDALASFYACPWHPEGKAGPYRREHPWRKPAPGMLLAAAADHAIDLQASWMIGDAERDIEAGRAAGCATIRLAPSGSTTTADHCVSNITAAVTLVMENTL